MPINKPKITPGQGLLLLIEYYQEDLHKLNQLKKRYLSGTKDRNRFIAYYQKVSHKLNQLKKLYLSGAKDGDRCIALCDALLDEPLLENYDLVIDEQSIDTDPSRRYFETHLAYQTLKYQLSSVDINDIHKLCMSIIALVDPQKVPYEELITIKQVYAGELTRPSFKKRENYQYSFYIKRLKEGTVFSAFSAQEREKIKWVERLVYMGLVNGWQFTDLPLDIYYTARFGNKERGRVHRVDEQRTTRNQNFGLLKGYMPLSTDDIAFSDTAFSHMKSADYSTFDPDSEVVQACFQQLVHPFSNSISGCFLMQLRVLARLHNDESSIFTENIEAFSQLLRLTISSSLYYSGGHSLHEYAAVLALPDVHDFFKYMPKFSELDLEYIFYHDNEAAFDEALQATLQYNARLIQKSVLHRELCTSRAVLFGNSKSPTGVADLDLQPSQSYLKFS